MADSNLTLAADQSPSEMTGANAAGESRTLSLLGAAQPFQVLPKAVLETIAEIADVRSYVAGETIAAVGQFDASEFFLVLSGDLKARRIEPTSGAMVVESHEQGSLYGLAEALADGPIADMELVSLTAEGDVDVLAIDAEGFRLIVSQRPTLTRSLMLYFANLVAGGALRAISAEASPEQRVYAALLEHVELAGPAGPWRVEKMPKHRELADRAGVDESFAAQAIAKIIHDGVVRRNYPGLIVEDIEKLKAVAA